MGNQKLNSRDVRRAGYSTDVAISLAMNSMNKGFKHASKEEKIKLLSDVLCEPDLYFSHEVLGTLAQKLTNRAEDKGVLHSYELKEEIRPFEVFGNKHIERNAMKQMEMVMRLPVAMRGALMPDAHQGYGLPIGGVLAANNAVIPY